MAEVKNDINGDGYVDVTDVQSLANKILNGEGGKVSLQEAAANALCASKLGMVANDPSKAAANATKLGDAIKSGVTTIIFDGTFHVNAAQIECNHPLYLIGGKLIIHRHKEWYYWLIKIVEGFELKATDIEFDGVMDKGISVTSHFMVFGNDTNVASTNPAYGANYDINEIIISSCKFVNVGTLKLVFKVNEKSDGSGDFSNCGIGNLRVQNCTFDNVMTSIAIMGGLIRHQFVISGNHVTNLNGSFVVHDRNVTGAVKQFKNNATIEFCNNYIKTRQPASASYVTAIIVKGHAAYVHNNTFDSFLGVRYTDEDKELMLADDNLKSHVVPDSSPLDALYDVYLSVADLEFYDNTIKNLISYKLTDSRSVDDYPLVSTCYSKQRYETKAWKHICRNKWVWDYGYCFQVLSKIYDEELVPLSELRKSKGLKGYEISKLKWIEQQYYTKLFNYVASFDEIVFNDNIVSIPNGVIYGISMINSPCAAGRYEIMRNQFTANYVERALCRFQPRYTTVEAKADDEYNGKTLSDWVGQITSKPSSAVKSIGYPVRYIDKSSGEVNRITNGTANIYFLDDEMSLKVDGEKYSLLKHELSDVWIIGNVFKMADNTRFLTLFKGISQIPTMGNDGYGNCVSDFIRKPYGNVIVSNNTISGTAYYVDPTYCIKYTETGNTADMNAIITCHPYATSSWRDNYMRQSTRNTNAVTLLPAADGKNGGNTIANTILLSGMVGEHTWITKAKHTKDMPLRFAFWRKSDVLRTMTLKYRVNGVEYVKAMTISIANDTAQVKCFDGSSLSVAYTKAASVKGADNVTVAVQQGYSGGSTVTGVQVNLTYINIYDCKIDGNLEIIWRQGC